jgi:hypothetical protein
MEKPFYIDICTAYQRQKVLPSAKIDEGGGGFCKKFS